MITKLDNKTYLVDKLLLMSLHLNSSLPEISQSFIPVGDENKLIEPFIL